MNYLFLKIARCFDANNSNKLARDDLKIEENIGNIIKFMLKDKIIF